MENGGSIIQETLLYDAAHDTLSSMRIKEEAHDYRYFPEPDLVPIHVDEEWIEHIRQEIPELRNDMRARFEKDYRIPSYDADILTTTPAIAAYYEEVIHAGVDPKKASNWMMGEVLRILNEKQIDIRVFTITPPLLASLQETVDRGIISASMAKTVFDEMEATGKEPKAIIEEQGLIQISDKEKLGKIARDIIKDHPAEVAKYKSGKANLLGFFVGEVMKATKGTANPNEANKIIRELLT